MSITNEVTIIVTVEVEDEPYLFTIGEEVETAVCDALAIFPAVVSVRALTEV